MKPTDALPLPPPAASDGAALLRAAVDSLPLLLAVLDCKGRIAAVNAPWRDVALAAQADEATVGVGVDYLAACERAARAGDDSAAQALAGLRDVLAGRRDTFGLEYACPSPTRMQWFRLEVHALRDAPGGGAIVRHLDITEHHEADARLRDSEGRYRSLLNNIEQGFCVIELIQDAQGRTLDYRFLEVNGNFERHTGLHDAVGHTARELVPELEANWLQIYGRVAATGQRERFELGSDAMGRVFDVEAVPTGAPGCRRVALLFSDITERRRIERRLHEQVALLDVIAQNSGEAIFIKDLEGRAVWLNDVAANALGQPQELLIGRSPQELGTPAHAAQIRAHDARVLEHGERVIAEERTTPPDRPGDERVWIATKTPWRDADGRVLGLVGVSHEITELRRAERALRASEARFRGAFEHAALGVAVLDSDGCIESANPALAALVGSTRSALRGRRCSDLTLPEDRAADEAALDTVLARRRRKMQLELRVARADGSVRWVSKLISSLLDDEGVPRGLVVLMDDITEARRQREDLGFLAGLSAAYAPLATPERVGEIAAQQLCRHLGVSQVTMGLVDAAAGTVHVFAGDDEPGLGDAHTVHHLADFLTRAQIAALANGDAVVVHDVLTDEGAAPMPPDSERPQIGAFVSVPQAMEGCWSFLLTIHAPQPRRWSPEDVLLLKQVAQRVHGRLHRARAEQALARSEVRLATALRSARLGAFSRDPGSGTLLWDPMMREIWGVDAHAPVDWDADFVPSIHPEDRARVLAQVAAAHHPQSGGHCDCEYRIVNRRDGTLRWISASAQTSFDARGRALTFDGVARDITARKHAETALAEQSALLQAITRNSSNIVFAKDTEGRLLFVNETIARYLDRPAHQLIGCRETDYLSPADAEAMRANDLRIMRSGRSEAVEEWAFGRLFFSTKDPWFDSDGTLRGLVGIAHDVSERREAERALRDSEERLRIAAETAGFGVHDDDPATDRSIWSHELYAISGLAHGTPMTLSGIRALTHPADRERFDAAMAAALDPAGDGEFSLEFRIVRADDGALRWLYNRSRTLFEGEGSARRAVRNTGVVLDITERKRAEEQLRDEAQRKDEFLAMLAHELRNPLAPIRTSVEVLRLRAGDAALVARCRDVIERQAGQMARLLDDLLDVSRLSRGKVALQRRHVSLAEVIDAAVETVRPAIDAAQQHLELPPIDERLVLDADPARLTQVFVNLLVNANKYSHAGGPIVIGLRALHEQGVVEVAVHDQGIGIAPEMLERVLEMFAQAPEARSHAPGGLGIGLALAHRLVQMHGGSLRVESDGVGRGASFTVRLLLAGKAAPALPGLQTGEAQARVGPPRRKRVLVADDNVDAADTLSLLLSGQGFEVRTTYDGESALRVAQDFDPEWVLLDLGMPGLDGYATCRRLRELRGGLSLAIVAVSGWAQDEDRRRSAMAGFDRHLMKPVDLGQLLAVLTSERA